MESLQVSHGKKDCPQGIAVMERPTPQAAEQAPRVVVRMNDKGELIGIEILPNCPGK